MHLIRDLPLWAKSLIAPTVALLAMLAMAGTTLHNLTRQETDVATLNGVAFEGLRAAMSATAAAADLHTELYHLTSSAANETDRSKIDAIGQRLLARLGALAAQVQSIATVREAFARYDAAARQVVESTTLDAAYGMMMMGEADQNFTLLRQMLAATEAEAEKRRDGAAADLLAASIRMRFSFLALASLGALLSIAAGLAIARAISQPTIRLTLTMGALAAGAVEQVIPDQDRRDEIGAMAKAVQVFRQTMIDGRRLTAEQAAAGMAREQRAQRVAILAEQFDTAIGSLTGVLASAAREMEATADGMLATAETTDQRSASVATAAEQTSANVQVIAVATEQLAASVREVSRQVAQSATIAGKAVADAQQTDATVGTLLQGAQKIGEVVTIIQGIAAQTNLLTLIVRIPRFPKWLVGN